MTRGARPKVYPPEMVASVRVLYESGMTQDEVATRLGTSQKVIWKLMLRHSLRTRPQVKRDQRGENNASWRGGRTVSPRGYALVMVADHPRADPTTGYVLEHIIVMERHLGRPLRWFGSGHPDSEIIHHRNGDKTDNRIENLELTTFVGHFDNHGRNERGQMIAHRKSVMPDA